MHRRVHGTPVHHTQRETTSEFPQYQNPARPAAIIIILLFAVALFISGYMMGMSSQSANSADIQKEMNQREQQVREKAAACKKLATVMVGKLDNLEGEQKALRDKNLEVSAKNTELYTGIRTAERQEKDCNEEREAQEKKWNEEDEEERTKLINKAKEEITKMEASLHELEQESEGMVLVLLHLAMKRARMDNAAVRVALQLNVPPATYEDQLIEKWSEKWGETAKPSAEVVDAKKPKWNKLERFTYDEEQELKYFFSWWPKLSDTVTRPTYFGRTGSTIAAPIGGKEKAVVKTKPLRSSLTSFTTLMDFALCAYESDNVNFTYPDTPFVRPPKATPVPTPVPNEVAGGGSGSGDGVTAAPSDTPAPEQPAAPGVVGPLAFTTNSDIDHSLSTLVDTPLVSFCKGCLSFRNTPEFHLGCLNRTAEALYGTGSFWIARSNVRFSQAVVDNVAEMVGKADMKNKNVLAFDITEIDSETACATRGIHAEWFSRNYNYQLEPISACDVGYPTENRIGSMIQNYTAAEKRHQEPIDLVLLFSPTPRHFNLTSFTNVTVVEINYQYPIHELASVLVMGYADMLGLNPYSTFSRVVLEHKLLRRRFKRDGIHFI